VKLVSDSLGESNGVDQLAWSSVTSSQVTQGQVSGAAFSKVSRSSYENFLS